MARLPALCQDHQDWRIIVCPGHCGSPASDENLGFLTVSCDLVGIPSCVFEGITTTKGYVDGAGSGRRPSPNRENGWVNWSGLATLLTDIGEVFSSAIEADVANCLRTVAVASSPDAF